MESRSRRSLRVNKSSDKYRNVSSSEDLSDETNSNTNSDANEITNKFSKLQTTITPGRRSQRTVKTPKKYGYSSSEHGELQNSDTEKTENVEQLKKTPGKRGRRKKEETSSEDDLSNSSTDSDNDTTETFGRPSEVLFQDEDVSGKSMFGFKRNQKRGGMAQKVFEVVKSIHNTPSTSETPSKVAVRNSIRMKIKKKVAELNMDSSSEDFSGSESSESELNSEEEERDSNESESDKEIKITTSSKKKPKETREMPTPRNNKNQNYFMKSDDYFSWQANSKIVTSNHTLQKLKNPKLSEDQLQELLTTCNLNQSSEHEKAIHEIFKYSCSSFNKWMYILHEGFNILLYGLGSKRNILKAFHKELLGSSPTIVVNGYFPSLTIKDITDSILLDIFEVKSSPSNVYEAVELITKRCARQKNMHLYLILHNIDGPMLRNNKSQNVLSSLADIPNIHLLASIDHINTPLVWDHYKLSKFNFTWWDVTSFLPYSDETSFESSMLVQRSGALALTSLGNVYQSLTKNSKGIFMLIVKYQLNNKSVKYYQGMPFKVLYSQCREHFLVSSDLALRTQLTEFLDHKLVKSKRTADGVEQLNIPIHNSLLQQFLEHV